MEVQILFSAQNSQRGKILKDKKNIVVIGAGYWGSKILSNLQSLGCLYAYVDEYTTHTAKKMTLPEALTDNNVDAVMIATPSNTHSAIIKQALESGKHVFAEKPLCLSLKEADELQKIADDRNLILMIGYLMMFHPATKKLKEMMEDQLKNCTSIVIQRQDWIKPRTHESVYWDLSVHDISMLFHIFSNTPKHAIIQLHKLKNYGADTIYYQGEIIDKNGRKIDIHLSSSWLCPTKSTSWTLCSENTLYTFQSHKEFEINYYQDNSQHSIELEQSYPLKEECLHFIECITRNIQPITSHSNTRPVMEWLDSIQN